MQQIRKYRAFISYRHTNPDKDIAIALQQQLERYRVPGYLRRQGYPERLGLMFRDESELPTSSDLGHQIETALDNSDYLIVVCSPNTPKSRYVAAEIDYFKKKKGDHKCLTVLAAGEPSSEKVFPDELLTRYKPDEKGIDVIEPIAADARGKRLSESLKKLKTAKYRIIAGLLGCNYDDLIRRQRERRLKSIAAFSMASAAFLICLGIFLFRQLYIVNENQKMTQIAYSEQSLLAGNRVSAMEQAIGAVPEKGILFAKDVYAAAQDTLFKASIMTAFSSYSQIPVSDPLEKGSFTPDGKQIVIRSDIWINAYDLQGKMIWQFNASGKGDRIIAVSPDGSRAVVVKTDLSLNPPTSAYLWDTVNSVCIGNLLGSVNYSVQDVLQMEYSKVLGADFSPDGRYVCVYRTGGYFNENDLIRFWDAATGKLIKTFDASCLGTREDGGQGSVINESVCYKNGTIRFTGSTNYVYLNPDWESPVTVPLREGNDRRYINLSEDERYGAFLDSSGSYCLADRSNMKTCILSQNADGIPDMENIKYIGQAYAIVPLAASEGSKTGICGFEIIDLTKMELLGMLDFSASQYGSYRGIEILADEDFDRVYIIGKDGYRKLAGKSYESGKVSLWALSLSSRDFKILTDDLYYLDEGTWDTTLFGGEAGDFLISRRMDGNGAMKALEIDPKAAAILNLYHIPSGQEFDAHTAQINTQANSLLIRSDSYFSVHSAVNVPGPMIKAPCEVFAVSKSSGIAATLSLERKELSLWNGNRLQSKITISFELSDLALSDNGQVLLGITSNDGLILWDTKNSAERCRIKLNNEFFMASLSPDGSRLAVIDGKSLNLYDTREGALISTLSEQADVQKPVGCWSAKMAFSPDGASVACITRYYPEGQDLYTKVVGIWNAETGEAEGLIPTSYFDKSVDKLFKADHSEDLSPSFDSLFFSDGGKEICTVFSKTISIWDVKTRSLAYSIKEDIVPQTEPSIREEPGYLFYAAGGAVHVWNLATQEIERIFTLKNGVAEYAVSPEKRWLLLSNNEGAWLYDLESGKHAAQVMSEATLYPQWTGDGESIALFSLDSSRLIVIPYLYNKPDEIIRDWKENME